MKGNPTGWGCKGGGSGQPGTDWLNKKSRSNGVKDLLDLIFLPITLLSIILDVMTMFGGRTKRDKNTKAASKTFVKRDNAAWEEYSSKEEICRCPNCAHDNSRSMELVNGKWQHYFKSFICDKCRTRTYFKKES